MGELFKNLADAMDEERPKGTLEISMAIFAIMELCGSFITGKTGTGTSRDNFLTFCESDYVSQKYHKISQLLYCIFRNGVVHSYVPKGAAHLTSDRRAEIYHLQFFNSGLCIYVPELAKDITGAIKALKVDLRQDQQIRSNYNKILRELDIAGKNYYSNYIREKNIKPISGIRIQGDINISI